MSSYLKGALSLQNAGGDLHHQPVSIKDVENHTLSRADQLRNERKSAQESPWNPLEPVEPVGILLVEDDWLLRKSIEEGLRQRGFRVWVAADGAEGIDVYQKTWPQIDVILSDVQMPILDGPQMLDVLRLINPHVRLCFVTGDVRSSKRTDLLRRGALRVFPKPFTSMADVADELWGIACYTNEFLFESEQPVPVEEPFRPVQLALELEALDTPHFLEKAFSRMLRGLCWIGSTISRPLSRRACVKTTAMQDQSLSQ